MKERPMLFNAAMVRAILDGRKTHTRRVVKFPAAPMHLGNWEPTTFGGPGTYLDKACTKPDPNPAVTGMWHTRNGAIVACPYGQPGDRLWVRETWNTFEAWEGYFYAADDHSFGIGESDDPDHIEQHEIRWRPSIHMPRAASRITLEITGVRVERLGDISKSDAIAEGIDSIRVSENDSRWLNYQDPESKAAAYGDPRQSFWSLWESINGPDSCEANPWVWAIEFRRVNA